MLIKDSESKLFQRSLVYKPFHYPVFDTMTQEHEKIHWITEEVEMSDDQADWRLNSSKDEKGFITTFLQIFTTGDVGVAQNYKDLFIPVFKNNEANNWFTSVANRETEHQRAYAMANETFGLPESTFGDFDKYSEMRNRIELMTTHFDNTTIEGLSLNLVHTAFNEGIGLMGAFASLLSLNRSDVAAFNGMKGRYKGFSKINKWSLREESMHVDGAIYAHKQVLIEHRHVLNDALKKQVYDLARKFVETEDIYLDLAFAQYNLSTITKEEIKLYIRYLMDRRLLQLGYKAIFGVKKNPCEWVDALLRGAGGKKMANFFETRVDDYQAAGAIVGDYDHVKMIGGWATLVHAPNLPK